MAKKARVLWAVETNGKLCIEDGYLESVFTDKRKARVQPLKKWKERWVKFIEVTERRKG